MRYVKTPVKVLAADVLKAVSARDFEKGRELLNRFFESEFKFPRFRARIKPYRLVVNQLLRAIEFKYNLLQDPHLRRNKKETIKSAINQHIDELTAIFKKWDEIYLSYELEDFRSTAWLIKSAFGVVCFWTILAFIKDYQAGPAGWWHWVVTFMDQLVTNAIK